MKKRQNLKKILKAFFVFSLIVSWLLVGWPPIWQNPRIPPEIQEAKADGTTDAMMVYDINSGTVTPKYRVWDGSSWGSEASANAVSGTEIRHMVLKYAPTRDEALLVVLTNTGQLQAQTWNGSSWSSVTTLVTFTDANGSPDGGSMYRGFDVEYEQSSGDAILVAQDGTADPNYYVWNGTSWTSGDNIDVPTTGRPYWIELASRPGSDELAMILIDSNTDVYGMRWTGSGWNNMGASAVWDDTAAIATEKCIDVAFETNSGDIMFIWGDTTSTDQYYRTYSGGSLSSATLLDNSQAAAVNNWMKLASDPTPSSNKIMYGVLDGGSDLNTFIWDGSAWSSVHTEHDDSAETHASMAFDIVFETHANNPGDAWLVYGDGNTISRKLWDGGTSSWGTATTQGDDTDYLALAAHPNSGAVFMVAYESSTAASDDITENRLTGGSQTWGTAAKMWDGPVRRTGLPFTLVAVVCESFVTSISITVSDGIVEYGIVPKNTAKTTLSSDMPPSGDMQTVNYDTNVTVNINIKGNNASGGGCTWTLASNTGNNQYVHQFCNATDNSCSSPPTNYTALTTNYQTLKSGVSGQGSVNFHLRLITPTESSCYNQQSVNVDIQAVQP